MRRSLVALLSPLLLSQSLAMPPPAAEVIINEATSEGSGCPPGSIDVVISPDRQVVTLGFDKFQAYIGQGVLSGESSKTCDIRLNLDYPGGYSYNIMQTTYHGFLQLDNGVVFTIETEYQYVTPVGTQVGRRLQRQAKLAGEEYEQGEEYHETDFIPVESRVNSPCGSNVDLIIRTKLSLSTNNSTAGGTLTDDHRTISFTEQLHIEWEKCVA
jgi:hypothetical protein